MTSEDDIPKDTICPSADIKEDFAASVYGPEPFQIELKGNEYVAKFSNTGGDHLTLNQQALFDKISDLRAHDVSKDNPERVTYQAAHDLVENYNTTLKSNLVPGSALNSG